MTEVETGVLRHPEIDCRETSLESVVDDSWVIESHSVPMDLAVLADVRTAVRSVLSGWRIGPAMDDVVLVASELVANALRHGCPVDSSVSVDSVNSLVSFGDPVRFGVCRAGRDVMLFVCDPNPLGPVPRNDPAGLTGRGLELVASLSSAWGWTPGRWVGRRRKVVGAERFGKTVWARFGLALTEGGAV